MAKFLLILATFFMAACAPEDKLTKGPYQWLKVNLSENINPEKVVLSKDGQHIYAWVKGHGLFHQTTVLAKMGFKLKKLYSFPQMDWLSASLAGVGIGHQKKLALFNGSELVWQLDASLDSKKWPELKDKKFVFSKVLMVEGTWNLVFGQGAESPGVIWLKNIDPNKAMTLFRVNLACKNEFMIKNADNSQNGDLLVVVSFTQKNMVLGDKLVNLFVAPILVRPRVSKEDFGKVATGTVAILPEDKKGWDWGIKNKTNRNINIQCVGSLLHKGEQHYYVGLGPDGINASMGLAHVQGMQRKYDFQTRAYSFGPAAQINFAHKKIVNIEVFRDYNLAVTAAHGLLGIKSDGTEDEKNNFNLAKFKAPKELWGLDHRVRSIEADAAEDTFLILVEAQGAYLRFR